MFDWRSGVDWIQDPDVPLGSQPQPTTAKKQLSFMATPPTTFHEKLQARIAAVDSLLCVGLDPHRSELAQFDCDAAFTFCHNLILATSNLAACYKPNAAFFEALGDEGFATLRRVCAMIPKDIPILLDVKRGDIGSTATAYASSCYDHVGADAVTLSPLMGLDSIEPFVTGTLLKRKRKVLLMVVLATGPYAHKAAFLLCKTSNPGSNDLLTLPVRDGTLFESIARFATARKLPLGLVVGATDTDALRRVRAIVPDGTWILAPGVGAQGGDLKAALEAGMDASGMGMLIPVSRGISRAENPKAMAEELVASIRSIRQEVMADVSEEGNDYEKIQPHQRAFLDFSLDHGVLKFGSFVLKSGRTSPYFFNAGLFASGRALHVLAKAYAATIMNQM